MQRRPFVCANWKLHHQLKESLAVLNEMREGLSGLSEIDLVVAPVATVLFAACDAVRHSPLKIAGQNVFHARQGAYTGEWSVAHLKELGCDFAIVGHSERRQYFAETNESVGKKVQACFEGGLTPIACIGETLDERKSGALKQVLKAQCDAILNDLSPEQGKALVIAYEPVWAIGTGLCASAEAAQEAHALTRAFVRERLGDDVARRARILYGGSVKADNAYELAKEPDIDGALVGGASLNAASFLRIARETMRAKTES